MSEDCHEGSRPHQPVVSMRVVSVSDAQWLGAPEPPILCSEAPMTETFVRAHPILSPPLPGDTLGPLY